MTFRNTDQFKIALHVLGLSPDVSLEGLKKKYYELSKEYHPDKYTDEKGRQHCQERFKEINAAYENLSIALKTPAPKRERSDSDVEEEERPLKRQRQEVEKTNFFKPDKTRKVRYFFKDEWHIKFTHYFFEISSSALRQKESLIIGTKDALSDGIAFIFPGDVRTKMQGKFPFELEQAEVNLFLDPKNQTHIFIPNDNKHIFIDMIELMGEIYQFDRSFMLSVRSIINSYWWDSKLYSDEPTAASHHRY